MSNDRLKFRAWIQMGRDTGRMLPWDEVLPMFGWALKYYELMQWTGLFDMGGQAVYEGDFLEFYFDGEFHTTGEVCWRKEVSIWAADIGIGLTTIEPEDAWVPEICYKVIGNRYENPELLERANG